MSNFCRYKGNSIIHKIDSRIKLLFLISFIVIIFLNYGNNYMNLLVYFIIFIIIGIISIISKSSFISIFKSLKGLWFMILLLFIINILFSNDYSSYLLFTIPIGSGLEIRLGSILNILIVFLRLVIMLMATNILTSTTKETDLTYAISWYLTPLKLIKIPVHKFSMALSLALRFIPSIEDEAKKVINAQASRGVDYKNGKIKEKLIAIKSLIIPIFMFAFLKSDELADAMEARGYDPDAKRTKFKNYKFSLKDIIFLIFILLILAGFITLAIIKPDFFLLLGINLPRL